MMLEYTHTHSLALALSVSFYMHTYIYIYICIFFSYSIFTRMERDVGGRVRASLSGTGYIRPTELPDDDEESEV